MIIKTPFASFDVGETMDGRLRIQLRGSGVITIMPSGQTNCIIVAGPDNRVQKYKTKQQMLQLANALSMSRHVDPIIAALWRKRYAAIKKVKLPDAPSPVIPGRTRKKRKADGQ